MASSMMRHAVILGLMGAVGPFAIDMFLPAMPDITRDLETSVAATQTTLTAYFIALGLAQLFYGPWADQAGRKRPIYVGLCVFILGTIGCVLAPNIEFLIASRIFQALGAAVLMVVPRAIIRDLYTGPEATRLMALIMLVISVSPMLAPLGGSLLLLATGWRMIFVALGIAAVLSLILTKVSLEETLPAADRVPMNLGSLTRGCRVLLGDRTFMALTFTGGFGMASFFVFIASASYVYTGQFGLSPIQFSAAFAANAAGFFAASQTAAPLGMKFGMKPVVLTGTLGFLACAAFGASLALAGALTLPLMILSLCAANAFLGVVVPTTMVMALEEHGDIAGLASSLGGTLQMVAGGLMIALSAPFFDGSATPLMVSIAICGVFSVTACLFAAPRAARLTVK